MTVQLVAQLLAKLSEQTSLDQDLWASIDTFLGLQLVSNFEASAIEERTEHTWPPEKPTATTPSSCGWSRNLLSTMLVKDDGMLAKLWWGTLVVAGLLQICCTCDGCELERCY
jgi:hypothetical protein